MALAVSIRLYNAALALVPLGGTEQPVFPSDHKWPDSIFSAIVIDRQTTVLNINGQFILVFIQVAQRFTQYAFWGGHRARFCPARFAAVPAGQSRPSGSIMALASIRLSLVS